MFLNVGNILMAQCALGKQNRQASTLAVFPAAANAKGELSGAWGPQHGETKVKGKSTRKRSFAADQHMRNVIRAGMSNLVSVTGHYHVHITTRNSLEGGGGGKKRYSTQSALCCKIEASSMILELFM